MNFDILTIFPDFFDSPLKQSISGKAIERGHISVSVHNIRDFAVEKHSTTDDAPYGGGPGMVMKPGPIVGSLKGIKAERGRSEELIILTSPRGTPFSQAMAKEFSNKKRITIVCGRYEGVDERVVEFIDMEVSSGDYVLTGGEITALTIVDAVSRFIPGVLGSSESATKDSFSDGLLEYPQYTRPEVFETEGVPEVLLSGNHEEIKRWRRAESLKRTLCSRPELLETADLTKEDVEILSQLGYKKKS